MTQITQMDGRRRSHPLSTTPMKTRTLALAAGLACLVASGCETQKFLDVNENPNAPQTVSANLYLPPIIHALITGQQFDGRFIGHYAQEWYRTDNNCYPTWGRMGHDAGSVTTTCPGGVDNAGEQWRAVYWNAGQGLVDMMSKAEAEKRWDLLGAGQVLKAWGWQALADVHGEVIVKEAFNQGASFSFNYDTQEDTYAEVRRLLNEAITNLQRTDGAVDPVYLGRTDKLFNGDRTRWLRLAYGLLAVNLSHYTNKTSLYKPADVIAAVDKSFASQTEDALFVYPNASADNADRNFLGTTRANLALYRQTQFVVGLLNGTALGGPVDPRMSRMLAPAPDAQYRGLDVNVQGFGGLTTNQQPLNPNGYSGTPPSGAPGRYVFSDKAKFPVMTYAQLQFIKAEAAYRAGDKATALAAYRNGILAHFAFVNARNAEDGFNTTQISATDRDAYVNNPAITPPSANALTLTQIMTQKYIAQWGWSHNELWMDLRRFNYTGADPVTGQQVFPGFAPPTQLFVDNNGKLAQRLRPRFNSEYAWNRVGLQAIGGLEPDFHTKPLWITTP
jgi:hypothetical protein